MHRSALCDAFKKVADRLKEFIMHNSGAKQYFSLFTFHFSLFTHREGLIIHKLFYKNSHYV